MKKLGLLILILFSVSGCKKNSEWNYFEKSFKSDYSYLKENEAMIGAQQLLNDTENYNFQNKIIQ